MNKEVEQLMEAAIETFKERGREYGHTWDAVGKITHILYPGGIGLTNPKDFAKFHILQWMIGKLVRYANSDSIDSVHDIGVYAFILESILRDKTK